MLKPILARTWTLLASLQLTILLLVLLSVLVVLCTLGQVSLGTQGAVELYMRSWVVGWSPAGGAFTLPVFPGGALVGLLLLLNLLASFIQRFQLSLRKAGIWTIHAGLILLVAGEFVTGTLQVDANMAIREGQTVSHLESYRDHELAVIDTTEAATDEVYGIPQSRLKGGESVPLPGTPLTIRVKAYHPNAQLSPLAPGASPVATAGVGAGASLTPLPPAASDKEMNLPAALVEPVAGGRSYGTWLVSPALGAPQSFTHEGRTYRLALRLQRIYLPFSLTLKDFKHDLYPGTNIPKNFSSLVRLKDAARGEDRDVLIFMNQPLRYGGRAFYQASFAENDTVSILQVVENPGWLLPYISCVVVTLGLLWHFVMMLRRSSATRGKENA